MYRVCNVQFTPCRSVECEAGRYSISAMLSELIVTHYIERPIILLSRLLVEPGAIVSVQYWQLGKFQLGSAQSPP